MGTEGGGLVLFNRETGQIEKRYADADGLSNNAVLNIIEDEKGTLWLSTFNGLSAFNPQTENFRNFFQSDGLQSNQFSYNAALRLQSGEIAVGGTNGFSIFQPKMIIPSNNTINLQLTGVKISSEPVANNGVYIMQTNDYQIEKVVVPYDKATFFFDFAALEYTTPGNISYAYYLEGWDKSWNFTGKTHLANYNRLNEGTYVFYVKATDGQGNWSKEKVMLTIRVQPPWYRTWWAYCMYFVIIITLIYLYNGYRVRKAELEYEVKIAKLKAEQEKELNDKKLAFFTNISHEFRTPLTLIIGPLKELVKSDKKVEPTELNVVYRNANRLFRLVEHVLQFQKAGSGTDQLKVVKTNFHLLCKEVFESFETQAQRKKLNYQYECSSETIDIFTDREKIEIVLSNLLSNAMKYTPEGGRILFKLQENNDDVMISISDTGPGIPKDVGEKLFERFYQIKESPSPSKPGFGIGLYLVKYFTELHSGNISYRSIPGNGTIFNLTLPKGKLHFEPNTVFEAETAAADAEPQAPASAAEQSEDISLPNKQPKKMIAPQELFSGKISLLVVEDDTDIRQYVVSIFEKQYNVYEAADGETGIRLAKTYLPELIISDVMMPNGTGIDLCTAVKGDPGLSHIPVILLTAASATDMKLKGVQSGADDYITKPFDKDLLEARVINLLKKRTVLQNYFYNEVTLQQNDVKISSEYKQFLEKCIKIVEAHLGDEQFNIQKLAKELGMSHSNLYKKIKSISGQSANSFIRFIRLRKAAEIFIHTDMNVNETSFEIGIMDVKYFRKHFYELFGLNPSDFIKKYRKNFSDQIRLNKDAFGNTASS